MKIRDLNATKTFFGDVVRIKNDENYYIIGEDNAGKTRLVNLQNGRIYAPRNWCIEKDFIFVDSELIVKGE